jgi:hypothetical protein
MNSFSLEIDALRAALRHIKCSHKRLYARIEKEGREAAKCNIGKGYVDSDWLKKGMADYRDAWRVNALRYMLQDGRAR